MVNKEDISEIKELIYKFPDTVDVKILVEILFKLVQLFDENKLNPLQLKVFRVLVDDYLIELDMRLKDKIG